MGKPAPPPKPKPRNCERMFKVVKHTPTDAPYCASTEYNFSWTMKSNVDEKMKYQMKYVAGERLGVSVDDDSFMVPKSGLNVWTERLTKGSEFKVSLKIKTPSPPGKNATWRYESAWQLCTCQGEALGPLLAIRLEVKSYTKEQEGMIQ